jgi:centriolar protein POC1
MDFDPSLLDPALERSFRGHKNRVNAVSFNPNMKQVASGGEDQIVMVWNFKPQLRAFRFVGHRGAVTSVQFSPNGKLLASGSTDNTVRLWTPTVRGTYYLLKLLAYVYLGVFSSCGSYVLLPPFLFSLSSL